MTIDPLSPMMHTFAGAIFVMAKALRRRSSGPPAGPRNRSGFLSHAQCPRSVLSADRQARCRNRGISQGLPPFGREHHTTGVPRVCARANRPPRRSGTDHHDNEPDRAKPVCSAFCLRAGLYRAGRSRCRIPVAGKGIRSSRYWARCFCPRPPVGFTSFRQTIPGSAATLPLSGVGHRRCTVGESVTVRSSAAPAGVLGSDQQVDVLFRKTVGPG